MPHYVVRRWSILQNYVFGIHTMCLLCMYHMYQHNVQAIGALGWDWALVSLCTTEGGWGEAGMSANVMKILIYLKSH